MISKQYKIIIGILVFVFIFSVYANFRYYNETIPGLLKVAVLDVGQGDAIYIETPSGNQVLIDGGPASDFYGGGSSVILNRLSEIMPFNDRDINVLVATHPHADHIQGLIKVLERFEIDMVIDSGATYDSSTYTNWSEARKKADQYKIAKRGDALDLGDDVTLEFLYPETNTKISKNKAHDKMLVAMLKYRDFNFLLTGDIEGYNELKLTDDNGEPVKAQFLKVAHHGSRNSTTDDFLNKISSHFAFISVASKNRYGHPHRQTLDRLDKNDVQYYRTDKNGTISLVTDGYYYKINTEE